MITIMDTGTKWLALGEGIRREAPSLPELVQMLYIDRGRLEGRVYKEGEVAVTKNAFSEYLELSEQISAMAEAIVDLVPKLANLQSSNSLGEKLSSLSPSDVIADAGVLAGRAMELQAGWAAIWLALNTPVEILPGITDTPVNIIYRRDEPDWISALSTPQGDPAPE